MRGPADNALTGGLFGTVKQEEIHIVGSYPDETSARYRIGKHIDHYNTQRPHQGPWSFPPHHIHEVNNNTLILEELGDLSDSEKTGHLKNRGYTMGMPRRSGLTLRLLQLDNETIGQRLARWRKERGCTQAEASEKIGIIQALISDYKRDKVCLHAGMAIRFAQALEVTTDELLAVNAGKKASEGVTGLRLPRRTRKIEELPPSHQKTLLKTMDTL